MGCGIPWEKFCSKRPRSLTVPKSTCAKKMDLPEFGLVASYKRAEKIAFFYDQLSPFIISNSSPIYHTQQINTLDGPKDQQIGGPDVVHLSARLDQRKQCNRIRVPANRELCVRLFGAAIDSCGSKPVTYGGSVTLYVLSLLLPVFT